MTDIAKKVTDWIEEMVLYGDPLKSDTTSLITSDLIDSTGAMELVFFLEETFGITVPNDQIIPANLDTVRDITALVERLSGADDSSATLVSVGV